MFVLTSAYLVLDILGEAFGTDCEKRNTWTVGRYEIREHRCQGWVGPYYYPLNLYEDKEKISAKGRKLDSCIIRFVLGRDRCLKLNICNDHVTELRPSKVLIDPDQVDSIVMVNVEFKKSLRLDQEGVKEFVQKWNNAPVHWFNDKEKPFYPKSSFIFNVYMNGVIRKFEVGNFLIKDAGSWSYSFLEPGEETSVRKFDDMWNELKMAPNHIH